MTAPLTLDGHARRLCALLTPRELEALQLVAAGHTYRTIAQLWGVEASTVRTHLQNMHGKLGTHTLAQVVLVGVRGGVIQS
jgi:DNA-binding CsgD family transcriptional regulator